MPVLFKTLLIVFGLGLAACSAKVKHASKRSPDPAAAEKAAAGAGSSRGTPVEVAGGLASARTMVQSRGTLALDVRQSAIRLGDRFSLVNRTTGVTLIDYDHADAALTGSYDLTLRLYLIDPAYAGAFSAGENSLRLIATSDDGDRSADTAVTLKDFNAFGMTTGVFPSGEQRVGGFQGGFEPFAKSTVSASGKGFLATGVVHVTNQ